MKWIKCSKELPEPGKEILVWFDDKVAPAHLISFGREYPRLNWSIDSGDYEDWLDLDNITHWMPLPEGPKDKDKE